MRFLVCDFETYYDKDYSLSKMTTEEYIRDPRFEIIGVSVKDGRHPAVWYSGSADGTAAFLRAFDISNSAVCFHNAAFDGAILAWRLGLYPKMLVDTLSMARPIYGGVQSLRLAHLAKSLGLGEKGTEIVQALGKRRADFTPAELAAYGGYCCNDSELCFKIFQHLKPQTTDQELRLIDATLRLFTQPMLALDRQTLEAHLAAVLDKQAGLLDIVAAFAVVQHGVEVGKLTPEKARLPHLKLVSDPTVAKALGGAHHDLVKPALMSNPQFADMLRLAGVEPPMKISPVTGKEAYAFAKTDQGLTELLEHESLLVQSLVAARLGVKSTIEQTRTERFLGIASRGTWPVALSYWGAGVTGRWAGSEKVNAQNLTRGGELRRAIMALPGRTIVACDSANIELRVNHTLAGQESSIQAFRLGTDLYCEFASLLYGRIITDTPENKAERFLGKLAHLSLGYGCGWKKFQEICRQKGVMLNDRRAREVVDLWRATYARIPENWNRLDEALKAMYGGSVMEIGSGLVRTFTEPGVCGFDMPNGRRIRYHDLQPSADGWSYNTRKGRRGIYGAKCVSGETLVLTDRGWVKLKFVRAGDLVHDGVEFVPHGGAVFTGRKPCAMVDGVLMTPDHKVLTDEGWKTALEEPRPYRPDLRHVDCAAHEPFGREEDALGIFVRLWEHVRKGWRKCDEGGKARRDAELRVRDARSDERKLVVEFAPNVEALGVPRVAQHAGPVFAADAPGVGQLRGARDWSVRALARLVRGVLGGHGQHVRPGPHAGQDRQRPGVFSRELPMDDIQATGEKSSWAAPGAGLGAALRRDGYPAIHAAVQARTGSAADGAHAGRQEANVYDVVNAGPRHQFVVLGDAGPFVVHNCDENICQALARHIIADQWIDFDRWCAVGMPRWRGVLVVHDEIVATGPKEDAKRVAAALTQIMSASPAWWPEIPLGAKTGIGERYGECK